MNTAMTPEELTEQGWKSIEAGGFTGVVGPFWIKNDGDAIAAGLIIEERHCNNHIGTVHGGVVMTFADIGLGCGVSNIMGEKRFGCVTTSLNTQFISVARIGEFIYCEPEIIRKSRQLIFVRGLIKTGDKVIASCEGIWKLMDSAS